MWCGWQVRQLITWQRILMNTVVALLQDSLSMQTDIKYLRMVLIAIDRIPVSAAINLLQESLSM